MRGCVAVLILFLSLPAVPQCNYSLGYSGAFRASYLDLAIDGNDLWAATAYGVQLFDRSVDPPALVASVAVPGITRVVRVVSGSAYAASGTRIYTIRKNGKTIGITGSVDAGVTVNDIVATPLYLYVATSNGLYQYDLLSLSRTTAVFLTTSANVTSLSLNGSTLYAADGDSSVEAFSITVPSTPQKLASFDSLARATSVKTSGSRVYVSDGSATDVFTAGSTVTKTAGTSFGASSLATLSPEVVFVAGSDRRYRALDWTTAGTPVELFASDIVPSGGTINRIGSIQIAGNRLYIAAGDAGLLTYDVSSFTAPFPVRGYPGVATTSAAWADGKLYVSRAAGGITEYTRNTSGSLTAARQWDARVHTVYEGAGSFLLTSSGPTLFTWALTSTIPTLNTSATFKAPITAATMIGFTAYVVLNDRTLWTADMGQQNPTPQAVSIAGFGPLFVAHSGNALAVSDVRDDGTTATTAVAFFPNHDLTSAPQTMSVTGSASSGLALNGSTAALFTFRGINLLDFASNNITVVPQSNTAIAQRLAFFGNSVFLLTNDALSVWDTVAGKLTRKLALPTVGSALAVDSIAAVPNNDGVIGVAYATASSMPSLLATRAGNAYYKKVLAAGDRLYLFDGRGVDVFETRFGFAPDLITSVRPAGIVDFSISPSNLFTITGSNNVAAWTRDGVLLAQAALNEGIDVQPNRMSSAGGAPWVSISRGCFTGACEKKTLVLDPKTLVRTAIFDGDVVEAAENGGRAFAVFDLPAEIRSYNLSDPLHPSLLNSIPAEGTKTPVSIAASSNVVYVDGEKLYTYTTSLTKTGEQYDAYQPDLTNTLQYVDQRVRTDGGCTLVSARTFSPLFTNAAQPIQVPAAVKSMASIPGRFYVLTEDSLEVWSSQPAVPAPRHRAAR